jgi:hypothetical protein
MSKTSAFQVGGISLFLAKRGQAQIIDCMLCKYIDRIFVWRLKINHAWSVPSSCVKFLGNILVVAKQVALQ